jgi:lipopolysaccharide/colanic/teichoic acid biosynthesis glycosyltransferase
VSSASRADGDLSYPAKRLVDLLVVIVIAPLAVAVMAVCALLVKMSSRGPIVFRQERVGHLGESFTVLKFRTMVDDPEGNPIVPDPSRVTGVGRWLRRLSLDELPQLVSVARGEMSIVGPRPSLRYQVDRYDERQRQRLRVRPGLTGLAQVRGRNDISWTQRIEWDLEYIADQSPVADLKVIGATLGVVVRGAGVEGHAPDDPISSLPA